MKKETKVVLIEGRITCTVTIPKEFSKENDFFELKEVTMEGTTEGLLIKKNIQEGSMYK